MFKKELLLFLLAGLTLWVAAPATAAVFSDGFEGTSINSFWTLSGPGSATLTTAAAHSGAQSLLLTASPNFPWNIGLFHDFGSRESGSVSVYVQTGPDCCSSAAILEIWDPVGGGDVAIERLPDGSFLARVIGPGEVDFPFSGGSPGWHRIEIDTNSGGVTFGFDGVAVFTNSSVTGFRDVSLGEYGAPGGGEYFDDFVFATPPAYSVCLLYDPTRAVKVGATIPIKLDLCDGSGNDLSSSSITIHAFSISHLSDSISGAVEDSGNANPDFDFRFDVTLGSTGGYIFNLKTTGLTQGAYSLNFTVTGDSSVYAAQFQVR
jgi:hypothetical protein